MANIPLDVGLNLVKECLGEKLSIRGWDDFEESMAEFLICHEPGLLASGGLNPKEVMEIIKTPIRKRGWEARLQVLAGDLFFTGVLLTGYRTSFHFMPISRNYFLNAAGIHALLAGDRGWEVVNQIAQDAFFEGDYVRWFFHRWYWACVLLLAEKANKALKKEEEQEEITRDYNRVLDDLDGKQPLDFDEFMQIVERYNLPRIHDAKEQSVVLRKYRMFPYLLPRWRRSEWAPIIFFGKGVTDDELLAQMDLCVCHQGIGDLSYLYRYLRNRCDDEDAVQETVICLYWDWKGPAHQFSFRGYCKQKLREFSKKWEKRFVLWRKKSRRKEQWWSDYSENRDGESIIEGYYGVEFNFEPTFPCSVYSASCALSNEFHKPVATIAQWLRRNMNKGIIPGCSSGFITYQDGGSKNVKKYVLDREAFEKARTLLRQPRERQRTPLINIVMKKRGVGRRAAQRWVKRRLDQGKSLEEIYEEIVKEHQKSVVGDAENEISCR